MALIVKLGNVQRRSYLTTCCQLVIPILMIFGLFFLGLWVGALTKDTDKADLHPIISPTYHIVERDGGTRDRVFKEGLPMEIGYYESPSVNSSGGVGSDAFISDPAKWDYSQIQNRRHVFFFLAEIFHPNSTERFWRVGSCCLF